MKRPFMVWIGFISICCSKVAKEGKSCPRLLVLQRVAQNAKSCRAQSIYGYLPPSIHSLFYKSHDPSVNYVTTQAGRGEKLENSISKFSKSLAEETER